MNIQKQIQTVKNLISEGNPKKAEQKLRNIIAYAPRCSEAWYLMGYLQIYSERCEEAIASLSHSLDICPHPDTSALLGAAFAHIGKYKEAMSHLESTLSLVPNQLIALNAKAFVLLREKKYEESIVVYRKLRELDPTNIKRWSALAHPIKILLRLEEAADIYRDAIQRSNESYAKYCLGQIYHLQGDVKMGFYWFNHRKIPSPFQTPRWQGEPIPGKTLLVHCEEGVGDSIQFMRYAPLLSQIGCRVIIELQKELHPLFEHLGFELTWRSENAPKHDLQVSLISLPYLFQTDLSTIPPPISIANARHFPIKNRVGIIWKGNPKFMSDWQRSMDLKTFSPLLQIPGITYVSLQKEISGEEAHLLDQLGVERPKIESWQDTVQALETCERVISTCTSIVHLAGSIGIPTWTILHYSSDWRWMLHRTDSPWYPNARLFRQSKIDSWIEPIEEIKALLGTVKQ